MGRFLLGLALGAGIGFAGAVLFAPERREEETELSANDAYRHENGTGPGLQRAIQGLQERLNDALAEAKEAAREAERDVLQRYERDVAKKAESDR